MTVHVYRVEFDLVTYSPVYVDGDDSVVSKWFRMIDFEGNPRRDSWESPPLCTPQPLKPVLDIAYVIGCVGGRLLRPWGVDSPRNRPRRTPSR
jgi:hypothetical protein